MFPKIAILHGQINGNASQDEQDTLKQVDTVSRSLIRWGIEALPVPLSFNLEKTAATLRCIRPDVVFNLVESVNGQGRLIHLGPALLDLLKIPYTGAATEAMFLTSNKLLAKTMLLGAGIPTPEWLTFRDLEQERTITPGRYIIKSVWEHASVGLSEESVIQTASTTDLRTALERRKTVIGGEGFAETYIAGRELNLSLLAGHGEPEVLPPAEIRFDAYPDDKLRIVDYRAKWDENSFEYHHTPRSFEFAAEDAPLLGQMKDLACQCWNLFGLRGYARVDFRVDQRRQPWVLEVNANPCLSPDAGFMAAAEQAGLSVDDVVARILDDTGGKY